VLVMPPTAGPEPSVRAKRYGDVTRGVLYTAPPHILDPDADGPYVWRDALNVLPIDGDLRRRPGITPYLTSTDYQFSATLTDSEAVVSLLVVNDRLFVATTRQLFSITALGGSWVNLTPTYTTGTVTATNGSNAVVGAGTAWSTRSIVAGQHILIDGRWYRIAGVTTDVNLTLTENFAGATAGGKTYTIRRNWSGGAPNDVSCLIKMVLFAGTLYVAGSVGSNGSPAVIKVPAAYTAAGSGTPTYITATSAYIAGLDIISDIYIITGIQALQDGRIVLSGATFAGGVITPNVVFYSSHLLDTVWTASPGGRTIVTLRPGLIYALGKIGDTLTLHFDDGIVAGEPTGLADPPLGYRLSRAARGCAFLHTLVGDGMSETYLSSDGVVYRTDLGSAEPVLGPEIRRRLRDSGVVLNPANVCAGITAERDYTLFLRTSTTSTRFWVFRGGSWWPQQAAVPITAATSVPGGAGNVNVLDYFMVLGVYSIDGASEVTLLREMDLTASVADTVWAGGSAGTVFVATDGLDFGNALAYHQPVKIIAFARGSTSTLDLSASIDGGATYFSTGTTVTFPTATAETPRAGTVVFDAQAAAPLLRFRVSWTASSQLVLTQLFVFAQESASIEGVEA
jgi:hypothetical protein